MLFYFLQKKIRVSFENLITANMFKRTKMEGKKKCSSTREKKYGRKQNLWCYGTRNSRNLNGILYFSMYIWFEKKFFFTSCQEIFFQYVIINIFLNYFVEKKKRRRRRRRTWRSEKNMKNGYSWLCCKKKEEKNGSKNFAVTEGWWCVAASIYFPKSKKGGGSSWRLAEHEFAHVPVGSSTFHSFFHLI